jgi:small subunit ribosomal protein S9
MRDRGAGDGQRAAYTAVGRRKTSVARVLLQPGNGAIIINGRPYQERFPRGTHQALITLPLRLTNRLGTVNLLAKVEGGGDSGQTGAIVHATARALVKQDESARAALREAGLLTRDPRAKERKKYGLKRARRAPQYTKR